MRVKRPPIAVSDCAHCPFCIVSHEPPAGGFHCDLADRGPREIVEPVEPPPTWCPLRAGAQLVQLDV